MYEHLELAALRTLYFDFVQNSKGTCFLRIYLTKFVTVKQTLMKHVVISKGTELLRVPADRLMYVSADGNYSNVVSLDNHSHLASLQLGQIEDLIAEQLGDAGGNFLRLGRGLIINVNYIYLIDIAKQLLVLSDCNGSRHELTASREVLVKLKAYIEAIAKTENEK